MGEQADDRDGPRPIVARVAEAVGLGLLDLLNGQRFAALGAAIGGQIAEIVAAFGTGSVGVGQERAECRRHGRLPS